MTQEKEMSSTQIGSHQFVTEKRKIDEHRQHVTVRCGWRHGVLLEGEGFVGDTLYIPFCRCVE